MFHNQAAAFNFDFHFSRLEWEGAVFHEVCWNVEETCFSLLFKRYSEGSFSFFQTYSPGINGCMVVISFFIRANCLCFATNFIRHFTLNLHVKVD